MADKNTKITNLKANSSNPKTHHVRTFFAAIFGIIALLLIFFSILVVWLNQSLTNTTLYVSTISPLATQPAVQNYIIQKVSSQLTMSIPTQQVAQAVIPASQLNSMNTQQIQNSVNELVNSSITQVVKSPGFAQLWKTTNESASKQLISQLNNNSSSLNLNLHPTIVGVINQLSATKLAPIVSKVTISPSIGKISITGTKVETVHKYYRYFIEATWVIVAATLMCLALCVILSVHHMKTVRRILVGTGVIALCLAIAVKVPAFLVGKIHSNTGNQKILIAIVNTLFHGLFIVCLVLGIVTVLIAIGSKIQENITRR